MTWRLITKRGGVINTFTRDNTIKGADSYLYLMDRADKTVYSISEAHRKTVLEFIKSLEFEK